MRVVKKIAAATALAAGAALAGTGGAQADTLDWLPPRCIGLSPYIVDMPHVGSVGVYQRDGRGGRPDIQVGDSQHSFWGYDSHLAVTWTNLNTGASGLLQGSRRVGFYSQPVTFYDVPTGAGPVRLDLRVTNVGPVPLPPVTCSLDANVR